MRCLRMDKAGKRVPLHSRRRMQAFTLVETVISILIIGVVVVATLNTVGAAKMAEFRHTSHSRGLLLAQDLMTEILQHPYWDPVIEGGMGPDSPEADTGNRSLFNDVDDYHRWSASPPQHRDGSAITWADGYRREVYIVWIQPDNLSYASNVETGIKAIQVTVTYNNQVIVELMAARTVAWGNSIDG